MRMIATIVRRDPLKGIREAWSIVPIVTSTTPHKPANRAVYISSVFSVFIFIFSPKKTSSKWMRFYPSVKPSPFQFDDFVISGGVTISCHARGSDPHDY